MPTENRSSNTAEPFKREDRYIVVKRSDLDKMHPSYKGNFLLELNCISAQMPSRKCLVIESDWPEYEPTWAAIERRVTAAPAPQQPEPIAWMVGTAIWWTKEEAERNAEATGLPIVPVGPLVSIPDGYCLMPKRLTAENGAKALLLGEFKLEVTQECPECRELDEPVEGCDICDGEGEYGQRHLIPWDKIRYIYSEAVRGLALQPDPASNPS